MNPLAQRILKESDWIMDIDLFTRGKDECRFYGATARFSPCPNQKCIQYAGGADFVSPDRAIEKAIFEAYERYSLFKPTDDHQDQKREARNSSGTAVHVNEHQAKRLATLELIERDAIMRFWYYKESAKWITKNSSAWLAECNTVFNKNTAHNIIAFVLPSQYAFVVLATIVGEDFPYFVSGAAASETLEEAIKKAVLEAEFSFYSYKGGVFSPIMRKTSVKTPAEHGLYYAGSKKNTAKLKWIYYDSKTYDGDTTAYNLDETLKNVQLSYIDISTRKDIVAIRATSPDLVPITFGYGADNYCHPALDRNRVKRVDEPHFFA